MIMEKVYTESQEKVINVSRGYNMVLAGPGCGKTDILAERIARAYESNHVKLEDVLCLTFTNRAARGMFDRIRKRLGEDASDLFVGNIHRYCSHFLFDSSVIPAESSIIDENDASDVNQSEITDEDIMSMIDYDVEYTNRMTLVSVNWRTVNDLLGIDIHPSGRTGKVTEKTGKKIIAQCKVKIQTLEHLIYQVQNNHPKKDLIYTDLLETPLMKYHFPFFDGFKEKCRNVSYSEHSFSSLSAVDKFFALAAKLRDYKDANKLLDFDDLLLRTYTAYYTDSEHQYKRYNWIQVDEIQDLSNFQISLVDLLTDTSRDYVVLYLGDEQQAIYSFMGASLDTLTMLKNRCYGHIFRLDKNFRSPKYLLDLYNEYAVKELMVDRDLLPEPKDFQTAGRYDIVLHTYEDETIETERIYNSILPYLRRDDRSEERTALLVPWNRDADEISNRLKQDGISHFKISGTDTFQTVHLKTLLAHLNVVSNEFNIIAWSRILKQTYAVDTFSQGRHMVEEMRDLAMTPDDLMRDDQETYLSAFCKDYDSKEIVIFDTETTGVDVVNDDIVQIAAIKIRNGQFVPGSKFVVFLETDKEIPLKLGTKVNPMVEAYRNAYKYPRREALTKFLQYVGDDILLGHNVNFDYCILRNNLRRDCWFREGQFSRRLIDSLKLAHLLHPKLKKYKLEFLIEKLGLVGVNSHMADDDIMATFELVKHCRRTAGNFLYGQREYFQKNHVKTAIEELAFSYKECYNHTKSRLFVLESASKPILVSELMYADGCLTTKCEILRVDRFDLVLTFLENDVIAKDEPNCLYVQFSNHLMDMSTYREADICDSSSMKEKLFVSTVHKAKGLEFENVVVMRATTGRYPHFAHIKPEQKEEDKRLFYVAVSRAMRRLIVSSGDMKFLNYYSEDAQSITPYLSSIIHRFCIRFELYRYLNTRLFVELTSTGIRIRSEQNGKVKAVEFSQMDRIMGVFGSRNLIELRNSLYKQYAKAGGLDELTARLQSYGIFSTRVN